MIVASSVNRRWMELAGISVKRRASAAKQTDAVECTDVKRCILDLRRGT
jgi:hypothetical protein